MIDKNRVNELQENQYLQMIMIQFTQDKTDLLNNYKAGQEGKVSINLRGRESLSPKEKRKIELY